MTKLYLIGSLRNPEVPKTAAALRSCGFAVFDDWFSAGPEADDYWQRYEQAKGHDLPQALRGHAARNVFEFDRRNLDAADAAVLLMPAGKSAHLELGYMAGRGKPTFVLMPEDAERWDVMYRFATAVVRNISELHIALTRAQGAP